MLKYIKIFGEEVPMFTLMATIGALFALLILLKTLKYRKIDQKYSDSLFYYFHLFLLEAF